MATTRRGTAQPLRKGARTPGPALAAALQGKAAGAANPMDQTRQLAKGATQAKVGGAVSLAQALTGRGAVPMPGAAGAAGVKPNAPRQIPGPVDPGSTGPKGFAGALNTAAKRSTGQKAPMAGQRKRAYVNGGQERENANGEKFREFTVEGRAGTYHEYTDPKTKKRKVRYVRDAVQTA